MYITERPLTPPISTVFSTFHNVRVISEPDKSVVITFFSTASHALPATKVMYFTRLDVNGIVQWQMDTSNLKFSWQGIKELLISYGAVDITLMSGMLISHYDSI